MVVVKRIVMTTRMVLDKQHLVNGNTKPLLSLLPTTYMAPMGRSYASGCVAA